MKLKCRILTVAALVVLVLSVTGCSSARMDLDAWPGKSAPFTRVMMLDGTTRLLSDFRGRTLVLTFWATWCSKSRRLAGHIRDRAREDAGRSDLVYLMVSLDKSDDYEKVREFIRDYRLENIQHAFSGNAEYDEAYYSFGLGEIPAILIIGPDGQVKATGHSADVLRELR